MPHVVLDGNLNLKDLLRNFKRVSVRIDDAIIKLDELFINAAENRLLAKAVVVESGKPRSFYLDVMLKGSSITVRLDDLTMPEEKSDGVKLSIALVANLLKKHGDLKVSKTNIVDQLSKINIDV